MYIASEGYEGYDGSHVTPFTSGNYCDPSSTLQGQPSSNTRWSYGRSINLAGGGSHSLRHAIANRTKVFQGSAVRLNSGSFPLFEVFDGATIQCWLEIDTANRRVNVYRGSGTGNLIAQSSSNTLPLAGNWCYIEWCPIIHPSTGSIEVRMDGSTVLISPVASLNTRASATSQITLAAHRVTGTTNNVDDYYLFDDTGSANNTFNGDSRVYTQFPDTDNAVQFTPSTGAVNADNVDDLASIDDDTTYNASSTVGHKDSFNIEQIPTTATVAAFEARFMARKDDAFARTGRLFLERASNTANGTTRALATAYVVWVERYENDPTDASALTATKVNAMHLGYELVA